MIQCEDPTTAFKQTAARAGWTLSIVFATLLGCLPVASAWAAGLQISPINLNIPADKKADEVWLRNTGTEVVHAQIRVYHWSQDQGEDVLKPDQYMVASPPMTQVKPGDQQLVRLVRVGPMAQPTANERSYRLLVDELPIKTLEIRTGLQFVFRYSIPVFIEGTAPAKPQLQWQLQEADGKAWLLVRNSGTSRGQLANIEFTPPKGKTVMVAPGLAGYALAGQYRRIELSASPALFVHGGTLTGLINGIKADIPVAPITKTP